MGNQLAPAPLCPLSSVINPGQFGAQGPAGVTMARRSITDLWQVAGWDAFEEAMQPLLEKLGFEGLGNYRQVKGQNDVRSWRIAPTKLLIENAGDIREFATEDLAVLDLSHAKVAIVIEGPNARDVLAQVISVDVSEGAFSQNDFIQTGLHHVGVVIQRIGSQSFEILVPYTWAQAVWEVLRENALSHGLEVRDMA